MIARVLCGASRYISVTISASSLKMSSAAGEPDEAQLLHAASTNEAAKRTPENQPSQFKVHAALVLTQLIFGGSFPLLANIAPSALAHCLVLTAVGSPRWRGGGEARCVDVQSRALRADPGGLCRPYFMSNRMVCRQDPPEGGYTNPLLPSAAREWCVIGGRSLAVCAGWYLPLLQPARIYRRREAGLGGDRVCLAALPAYILDHPRDLAWLGEGHCVQVGWYPGGTGRGGVHGAHFV